MKPETTPLGESPDVPWPQQASAWLRNRGERMLGLLLLAGLFTLCLEVWQKQSLRFDTDALLWLHGWANPILDALMLWLTRLGNPYVVVPVVLGSLGVFLWRRWWADAVMLLLSCVGVVVLNQGMKLLFARARPALWPPLIQETTYGFPSGHAMGSLVLYGYLSVVLAYHFPTQARWIHASAVLLVVLIGLSRLYLGVHYPTDIAAGYAVGGLWLMVCLQALKAQRLKRSVVG